MAPVLSPWLHCPVYRTGPEKQSSLERGCPCSFLSRRHTASVSCSKLVWVRLPTMQVPAFSFCITYSPPSPLASQTDLQSLPRNAHHISCLLAPGSQQCGRTGAGDRPRASSLHSLLLRALFVHVVTVSFKAGL